MEIQLQLTERENIRLRQVRRRSMIANSTLASNILFPRNHRTIACGTLVRVFIDSQHSPEQAMCQQHCPRW